MRIKYKGIEMMKLEKPRILAIVGSLRKDSYNRQLALAAKEILKDKAELELLDYADIPYMNEDIEFPTPESISRVREAIKAADGIWFFTPEYNYAIPGVLKNLLDWLSRPATQGGRQVLSQKPAAVSGITPGMSGTGLSQQQLYSLIGVLNMQVLNYPRLTIPNAGQQLDAEGRLALGVSLSYLEKQAEAFVKFIQSR